MAHHTSHFSPQGRRPNSSTAAPAPRTAVGSASDADIARRAYEKYESRGRVHGFDREDWTAASRELVAETFRHLDPSPSLSPSQHAS
jgi:Protein of unknown function (DUF2934)